MADTRIDVENAKKDALELAALEHSHEMGPYENYIACSVSECKKCGDWLKVESYFSNVTMRGPALERICKGRKS